MKEQKLVFSNEQLEKILKAQDSLNVEYSGESWRENVPVSSFFAALFTEIAEYLESAPRVGEKIFNVDTEKEEIPGWKWWKKNLDNDTQNMMIEGIDTLHFSTSIFLQALSIDKILEANQSVIEAIEADESGEIVEAFNRTKDYPIEMLLVSHNRMFSDYMDGNIGDMLMSNYVLIHCILNSCDKSIDDLYNGYFLKNELNLKRIEGGYMTGDYEKVNEAGEEDNRSLEV